MADEMQQRERDAKRQEIERQKNRKKTMAAEAAASDKAQRRDMTQEEIQEINKVVRLRRETESQHRLLHCIRTGAFAEGKPCRTDFAADY